MTNPGNIVVCGTDLGDSGDHAVHLAVAIARKLGARLHLVHAVDAPELDDDALAGLAPAVQPAAEAMRQRLLARREKASTKIDELAFTVAAEVESKVTVHPGRPWEVLLDAAEGDDATLVVVGPHAKAPGLLAKIGERILGTTARRVVRHAGREVLVASGDAERTADALRGSEPMTMVVGIDFESGGWGALEEARRIGGPEAKLVLVHVLQDPFAPGDAPVDWPQLRDQWLKQLEERLAQLTMKLDNPTEPRVEHGDPAHAVLTVAQETNAHMLVVGAHAGGPLSRILLGSTAERCLRDSPVPVLVVPPREAEQPTP